MEDFMTNLTNKDKKDFLDPVTASAVSFFAFRSFAQAVIGWLGVEFLKFNWRKGKEWYKNEKSNPQEFPRKESQEET